MKERAVETELIAARADLAGVDARLEYIQTAALSPVDFEELQAEYDALIAEKEGLEAKLAEATASVDRSEAERLQAENAELKEKLKVQADETGAWRREANWSRNALGIPTKWMTLLSKEEYAAELKKAKGGRVNETGARPPKEERRDGLLRRAWTDHRLDLDFDEGKVIDPDVLDMIALAHEMQEREMNRDVPNLDPKWGDTKAGHAFKSNRIQSMSRSGNAHIFAILDCYRTTHGQPYLDMIYDICTLVMKNIKREGWRRRFSVPAQNGYPALVYVRFPYLTPFPFDRKELGMSAAALAAGAHYLRVNEEHDERYRAVVDEIDEHLYLNVEQLLNHVTGGKGGYPGTNVKLESRWWPTDNISHSLLMGTGVALWYRYLDARDHPDRRISHHTADELKALSQGAFRDVFESTFDATSRAKKMGDGTEIPALPSAVWLHKPEEVKRKRAAGQLGDYPNMTGEGFLIGIKEGVDPSYLNGEFARRIHTMAIFVKIDKGTHWENRPRGADSARGSSEKDVRTDYLEAEHTVWPDMWGSGYGDGEADDAKGEYFGKLTNRERGITAKTWQAKLLHNGEGGYTATEIHDWNRNGVEGAYKFGCNWRDSDPIKLPHFGSFTPFASDQTADNIKQAYWFRQMRRHLDSDSSNKFMTQVGPQMLAASLNVLDWDVDEAIHGSLGGKNAR